MHNVDERKQQIIDLLNKAWKTIDSPDYESFNAKMKATNVEQLMALEAEDDRLGIADVAPGVTNGLSVLSLIATITDIAIDDRLAAILDDGKITGWCWCPPLKTKDE